MVFRFFKFLFLFIVLTTVNCQLSTLYASAEFLLLPTSARSGALGGIRSAYSGVNSHPASLFEAGGNAVLFSHSLLPERTRYSFAEGILSRRNFVWSAGFAALGSDGIPGYGDAGNFTGDFSAAEQKIFIKGALRKKRWRGGVSMGVIQSRLGKKSASSVSMDLGGNWRYNEKLSLDILLENLGTPVRYDTKDESLPLDMNIGISYVPFRESLSLYLQNSSLRGMIMGSEWKVSDILTLRAGYITGDSDPALRMGFGIGWERITLDFSIFQFGDFPVREQVSLNYFWGKGNRRARFKEYLDRRMEKAVRLYRQNSLLKAHSAFSGILGADPQNREAGFYISRARLFFEGRGLFSGRGARLPERGPDLGARIFFQGALCGS